MFFFFYSLWVLDFFENICISHSCESYKNISFNKKVKLFVTTENDQPCTLSNDVTTRARYAHIHHGSAERKQ